MLADPASWTMVVGSSGAGPVTPHLRCTLSVDGVVAATKDPEVHCVRYGRGERLGVPPRWSMARSIDLTGWLTLLADGLSTEFGVAAATPKRLCR